MLSNFAHYRTAYRPLDNNPISHFPTQPAHARGRSVVNQFSSPLNRSYNSKSPFTSSAAMQLNSPHLQQERLFKNKLRSDVYNPITGSYYRVARTNARTDNAPDMLNFSPSRPVDKVAGAMRKPVETGYFNPYAMKYAQPDPAFQASAAKFFDN